LLVPTVCIELPALHRPQQAACPARCKSLSEYCHESAGGHKVTAQSS
jgi:hypothetical protein